MAIPTTEDQDRGSKFAAVLHEAPIAAPKRVARRRRIVPRWLVMSVVAIGILGLGVAAAVRTNLLVPSTAARQMLTEKVRRTDLVVSVTEDGDVQSAQNVDIKCEVKGGSTILWIIRDGTSVEKGDELVRLDSALIEDQISVQTITTEKAKALMIDAQQVWEAAKIAVKEFEEGLYVQQLKTLEVTATVAKENLESAKNLLQFYNRMARQGYVTSLQRDAQEFAVERAQLDLDVANKTIEVLEKFTKEKTVVTLASAEASALARMKSEEAAYDLESDRLKRLQTQLELCVIRAPGPGMVVYANEDSGRRSNEQTMVEEGAMVRERQTLLRLPDLSRMQVKCAVHESKIDLLERGMRARVRIQGHDFQGTVMSVANQAEPSNWFMGNVKEYSTIVSIDSDSNGYGLRPGMTSAVEILVANLKNVVGVPVQAVVEQGGKFYCWVSTLSGPERRPVLVGMSNNTRIEIKDGLAEGDEVLLNPRAVVAEARQESKGEEAVDVTKKFGGDTKAPMPPLNDPGDDRGPRSGDTPEVKSAGGPPDIMSYDTDGDHKISKDEAPEQVQQYFDRVDTDADGMIDAKEAAVAKARRRQKGRPGGGPEGTSIPGGGGP